MSIIIQVLLLMQFIRKIAGHRPAAIGVSEPKMRIRKSLLGNTVPVDLVDLGHIINTNV